MGWMNSSSGFHLSNTMPGGGGHPSISDDGAGNVIIADDVNIEVGDGGRLLLPTSTGLGVPTVANKDNLDFGLYLGLSELSVVLNSNRLIRFFSTGVWNYSPWADIPDDDQFIDEAGDAIAITGPLIKLDVQADVTLTSTPTIPAGFNGQLITLENVGDDVAQLQDNGDLNGSLLTTEGGVNIQLGARDMVTFRWSSDSGRWVQVAGFANVETTE